MSIKVLMIDDDPAMTELIALLLRSHGLEVLACTDSTQSVEMVRRENPDVILLDLMMPGQDGWEVCRAIRAFSRVPIAILSAIDDPAVIASALDSGADDYLVKPTPGGVLVAHINNLARRHLAGQQNTLIRHTGPLVSPPSSLEGKPLQA